ILKKFRFDELSVRVICILLGELAEGETRAMSHYLMTKCSGHSRNNEGPGRMFKNTLVSFPDQIFDILEVTSRRLIYSKRHITHAARDLDKFFWIRRSRQTTPLCIVL